MKFIDFFDRTYVINLPSRSDRRKEMEKELENAGIPFTLGKVELFSAIRPENPEPFKSIGSKGAFLSHLNVLKKAKAGGLRNVLIMEDDLKLRRDFQQYEEIILGELLENAWDIAHFGYCSDGSHKYVSAPILQPFSEAIIGAQFYAVHGKSFDKLISFLESLLQRPVGHPNGGPMSLDGGFNVFKWQHPNIVRLIAVPSFGDQRSSRSDISPKWFDHLSMLKPLIKLARSWGLTKSCKSLLKSASYVFNRTE